LIFLKEFPLFKINIDNTYSPYISYYPNLSGLYYIYNDKYSKKRIGLLNTGNSHTDNLFHILKAERIQIDDFKKEVIKNIETIEEKFSIAFNLPLISL